MPSSRATVKPSGNGHAQQLTTPTISPKSTGRDSSPATSLFCTFPSSYRQTGCCSVCLSVCCSVCLSVCCSVCFSVLQYVVLLLVHATIQAWAVSVAVCVAACVVVCVAVPVAVCCSVLQCVVHFLIHTHARSVKQKQIWSPLKSA